MGNRISSILSILFCVLFIIVIYPACSDDVRLFLDSQNDLCRFRKLTDPFIRSSEKNPSREGLEKLKASGSNQFSEKGLKILKERLKGEKIIIVDLRQESHGFIDGVPVSWRGECNWANLHKSLQEIEKDEMERLNSLLKKKSVIAVMFQGEKEIQVKLSVKNVRDEKELCKKMGVGYFRLPVPDHRRPDDKTVDKFIAFIKSMPEGSWLHFHCKAGKGRTSTFLAMYDMMHNAKKVSIDDIILRQYFFGSTNLFAQPADWKYPYAVERSEFLRKFYDYCVENKDNFNTPWSEYILSSNRT